MANHEIKDPKQFTTDLRILETTDPAHADTFNPLYNALLNNDAYLKSKLDNVNELVHSNLFGGTELIPEMRPGDTLFIVDGAPSRMRSVSYSNAKNGATAPDGDIWMQPDGLIEGKLTVDTEPKSDATFFNDTKK